MFRTSNVVMNHRGRVRLSTSALLTSIAPPPPPIAANETKSSKTEKYHFRCLDSSTTDNSGLSWSSVRDSFRSKRRRDTFDFALMLLDFLDLPNDYGEPLADKYQQPYSFIHTFYLDRFQASLLMLDFFERLCGSAHRLDIDEGRTLPVDVHNDCAPTEIKFF